jgi:hypothetical protein
MEIMNKTLAIVLITLLGVAGLAALVAPRPTAAVRTEAWLEEQVPERIGGFEYIPSPENPKQSYKMEELVYNTLNPRGIVARIYSKGAEQYDVVIVNSDNGDSFHDPRVCFQSQGSSLENERTEVLETKGGPIPVKFVETSYNGERRLAAYTYKGPNGYNAEPLKLLFDIFKAELTTGKVQEGTFYRIISTNVGTELPELKAFTRALLEETHAQSNGVL